MDTPERRAVEGELRQSNGEQSCPECGATTMEANRLTEGRARLVRYTCSTVGCDGKTVAQEIRERYTECLNNPLDLSCARWYFDCSVPAT